MKKNNEVPSATLRIKKIHPLVTKTKQELNITKSYRSAVARMEWDRQKNILAVHTDKNLQKRALNFMNIFLFNMEKRGMKIKFDYGRCNIELYNQTIEINLRQKYHRVRTNDDTGWSRQEFVKSNKLEFLTGYHARKSWLDTEQVKIEERIPNILDYIEKDLTYWRDVRKQQAEQKKIEEIELQKQQEIERLQKIEEEKTVQLFLDAENWRKAELIRRYREARITRYEDLGKINIEFEEWLEWVNQKIEGLDPLY